jgi:hypothetical protein
MDSFSDEDGSLADSLAELDQDIEEQHEDSEASS